MIDKGGFLNNIYDNYFQPNFESKVKIKLRSE